MVKQNAVNLLKESIRLVELRQEEEGKILKEQFRLTFESLKPVNLIKSSIKDLVGSVEIKNSIFESIFTIVSGYFTQKFIVNSKSNVFIKTLGVLLQYGVTNLISKNSEDVRNFFSNLIERFINPAEEEEIPEPSEEYQ
jgi:hypothetical protein